MPNHYPNRYKSYQQISTHQDLPYEPQDINLDYNAERKQKPVSRPETQPKPRDCRICREQVWGEEDVRRPTSNQRYVFSREQHGVSRALNNRPEDLYAIDRKLQKKEDEIHMLRQENAYLTKELHRLKKIEAGWVFGRKEQKGVEHVNVHNTYLHENNDHFSNDLNNLHRTCENLKREKRKLGKDLQSSSDRQRDLEISNERLKQQVSQFKKEKSAVENEYQAKIAKIEENYRFEAQQLKQEINKANREKEKIRSKVDREIQRNSDNVHETIQDVRHGYEQTIHDLQVQYDTSQRRNQELERQMKDLKGKVEHLKALNNSSSSNQSSYNQRIKVLEDENSALRSECSRKEHQLEELRPYVNQNEQLRWELGECKEKLNQYLEEIDVLNNRLHEAESKEQYRSNMIYLDDQDKIQERENIIALYKRQIKEKDEKINALKATIDSITDENHRLKLNKTETDTKLKVSSLISDKHESQETKALKIRLEESENDNKYLRKEIKKLRKLLGEADNAKGDSESIKWNNGDRDVNSNIIYNNHTYDANVKDIGNAITAQEYAKRFSFS